MFGFYFLLYFVGITLCTGNLRFSRVPKALLYRQEGSDAVFFWEYDKSDELQSTTWQVYNKTQDKYVFLRIEDENGTNLVDPAIPPAAYVGRIEKNRSALVIKNVKLEDTTSFKCTLKAKPGFADKMSIVDLVVTGLCTINPQIQPANVGGSVTFTCKAANVPSQNFTWTRGVLASEKIVNDSQHSVISVAGSSQLTVKNIAADDLGYYVCDATVNINQPCLPRGYLQVLRALKKDETNCAKNIFPTSMSSQLTICCPVSGYPPPVVTWEKDGIELQKGENTEFTIAAVKEEHFGHYSCTATDGITSLGPFDIIVFNKVAKLSLNATDGTERKPAKLTWEAPQPEPDYFTVEYAGSDILDNIVGVNVLVGKQQSLEFHYHTLVLKEANNKPDQTDICAEVTAFKDKIIVGVSTACQKMTIKKPSDTEV